MIDMLDSMRPRYNGLGGSFAGYGGITSSTRITTYSTSCATARIGRALRGPQRA